MMGQTDRLRVLKMRHSRQQHVQIFFGKLNKPALNLFYQPLETNQFRLQPKPNIRSDLVIARPRRMDFPLLGPIFP